MFARINNQMEKEIRTKFRGNYNMTFSFLSADKDGNGFIEESEYRNYFDIMDRNGVFKTIIVTLQSGTNLFSK